MIYLVMFPAVGCVSHASAQSVTPDYSIVYSGRDSDGRHVYLSDEDGKSRIKLVGITGNDGYPSVSTDGKRLAFYGKYDERKTWSIHTVNMDGSNVQRLTNVKNVWDSAPTWSPDGKTIAFAREYDDPENGWQEEVWLMNADGSEQRQIESLEGRAPYFLADGRLLFHSKAGPSQICITDVDGSNVIKLTDNESNDWSPKVSPDGQKIIFISDRDGNREIYTMNIDGSEQTRITLNEVDDWDPAWSADGSKLFFASENSEGSLDIYKANADGSSKEKIIEHALQITAITNLDNETLQRLMDARQ
ncbi:MAG: DUF5050 domain-containing protein [Pseudomonadota bacterium]